jgi:hypothetical protein
VEYEVSLLFRLFRHGAINQDALLSSLNELGCVVEPWFFDALRKNRLTQECAKILASTVKPRPQSLAPRSRSIFDHMNANDPPRQSPRKRRLMHRPRESDVIAWSDTRKEKKLISRRTSEMKNNDSGNIISWNSQYPSIRRHTQIDNKGRIQNDDDHLSGRRRHRIAKRGNSHLSFNVDVHPAEDEMELPFFTKKRVTPTSSSTKMEKVLSDEHENDLHSTIKAQLPWINPIWQDNEEFKRPVWTPPTADGYKPVSRFAPFANEFNLDATANYRKTITYKNDGKSSELGYEAYDV